MRHLNTFGPPLYRDNLADIRFYWRVAFTSYGAFWLSFATLFIPGSGIGDAYKAVATTAPAMEDDAIGIFLMAWMVLTALFL
jgi:succinate-acetate transporter protein